MGMLDVTVTGDTAIISGLTALHGVVLAKAYEAIAKATMSTFDESQIDVPVLTGALRASGEFDISHPGQGTVSYGGGDVTYSLFVELGTVNMAAQPYLFPNFLVACDELKADLSGLI